jgi:acyl-CoA synthetase (AMP-forming)/AMP-acid ligase II
MTYRDLWMSAQDVARALLAAGVERGDRVAIWAPNSVRWIQCSFGVYCAGAVLVPMNTRYTGAEAKYILDTAEVDVLVTVTDFMTFDFLESLNRVGGLENISTIICMTGATTHDATSWSDFISRASEVSQETLTQRMSEIAPDSICDIIFTSGTTGAPKGAELCHQPSVRTYTEWSRLVGLQQGDRYFSIYPYFHTAGLKSVLLACVLLGATVYPYPTFDVQRVLELIEREQITMLPGPPTMFQMILDHPGRLNFDLSSVRTSVTGAAIVPVELIRRMREELGIPSVVTAYGLTETTGTVTVCSSTDSPEVIATTVGKPIPGLQLKIVNDDGIEQATGADGEILVRGFNVMRGYFKNPSSTAEAVKDGWLHTGDIGHVDHNGNLRITDRKKDMFIVGGFNAYPAEVEATILQHPSVSQVAVVGLPDDRLGEIGVAFVIPRPDTNVDEAELLKWAHERLAKFKLSRIQIVSSLPTGPSGKVQKFKLREQYG